MKHLTTTSQTNFYHEHGWIYFEQFFDPNEIDPLAKLITPSLKSHDLWRDIPLLKKLISKQIAPTVFSLQDTSHLRLAFDQFFRSTSLPKEYASFFSQGLPWQDFCSFQQIICCAVMVLENRDREENPLPKTVIIPSFKKGDLLFFSPEKPTFYHNLILAHDLDFLVIGFANLRLIYKYNPIDPLRDDLKKMGYQPGDKVLESTHPCLRKKG